MAIKLMNNVDLLKSSTVIKFSVFVLISVASFYFGKEWFQSDGYQRLRYFPNSEFELVDYSLNGVSNISSQSQSNDNASFSSSFHPLQEEEREEAFFDSVNAPPPPLPVIKRMGVLDENGVMKDDFEVGDFDPNVVEIFEKVKGGRKHIEKVRVEKFRMCPESTREYIPCLTDKKSIDKLNYTNKEEIFERHCPEVGHGLNCLIPAPKGYQKHIPWPNSRGEVWLRNVPHTRLLDGKGSQNWITISGDKVKFSGGDTQFIHGPDQYLDQIEKMVPEIAFGERTRVVLDVGCGVASFGAYLFSRNVLTFSIGPKDVHENQIQLALERGVPGMVAAFARKRLPYPSQGFDMIHCSRCLINWTRDGNFLNLKSHERLFNILVTLFQPNPSLHFSTLIKDGVLLLEVDRILRAGGYFVWAAETVYKHELLLKAQWEEMANLTDRLCWNLVKKEGYISIWQKPLNNSCYLSRKEGTQPPLCKPDDDPDKVWYVDLKPCITRLPDKGFGSNVTIWPARLLSPPDRLQSLQHDAYICRKELFKADTKFWDEIVEGYIRVMRWKSDKFRNVLDMRAGFGGFAAALIDNDMDFWVLNVVPVSAPNTLSVIYDRGLIGVMHDWCEPFDTYPRTYDLIHAAGLFSIERKRCNISTIMLEMDRILRPGGDVYIRDSVTVVDELKATGNAIGWHVTVRDTAEGPHSSYRFLVCNKRL